MVMSQETDLNFIATLHAEIELAYRLRPYAIFVDRRYSDSSGRLIQPHLTPSKSRNITECRNHAILASLCVFYFLRLTA